jgi:hypothetical protein
MRRISDYLATLTAAELEQFRDAIEDSLQRELPIQDSARREAAAVVELAEQHRLLMAKLWELEQTGQRLLNSVGRGYLQTVPVPTKMN